MIYDVIIIGAGPSGLTAAIYALLARKTVLLLEKNTYGGQILNADVVKNYPGLSNISGYDYAKKLYDQVIELKPDIKFEEVIKIEKGKSEKTIYTKTNSYKGKTIIIATGAESKKLNIKNEDKLLGKGISYCATCDGNFFKNKDVAVVGGGNAAIEEALYLSNLCKKVYVIYYRDKFKMESVELEALKNKNNVEFLFNYKVNDVIGIDKLEEIEIKDTIKEKTKKLKLDGLFIAIGHTPVSSMCKDLIEVDTRGYIDAEEDCKTNVNGIYVCGDIRKKEIRQLTTACSDGTVAALAACKYLATLNRNLEKQ